MLERAAGGAERSLDLATLVHAMPVPAAYSYAGPSLHIGINAAFGAIFGIDPERYTELRRSGAPLPFHFELDGRRIALDDSPLARAERGESVSGMPMDVVVGASRRRLYGWATPVGGADGKRIGALAVFQDVTARVEADERFRDLANIMPQLMWTVDADGRVEWHNDRWFAYTGRSAAESVVDGSEIVHPDDLAFVRGMWGVSRATGQPFEVEYRLRAADGSYRWFLARARCTRDASDRIVRWYGSDTDVDEVRRLTRSLATLSDLGRSLSASLGLETTLDVAMEILVPEFADWAFVDLCDEEGDLRIAAAYHPDERKRRALRAHVGDLHVRGDAPMGSARVVREGKTMHIREASYSEAATVVEPNVLATMWDVGIESALVLPLSGGASMRGTLTVIMYQSFRKFSIDDVALFEEVARRVGPALANAEIFERERRVARSFQQAALPAELPNRDGFRFSAIYEAGKSEALVGGDWYDAFALADGRIVVSIGDVAGSGLQAAVTMSSVRQSIRAVAQIHAEPALMLEAADRTLRQESPDRFVTAFVGVIDPVSGAFACSGAGHPPPLVRSGDGQLREIVAPGLPLGLRDAGGTTHVMTLPTDAFLVLYTDGLIESTHDADEGERRLRAALLDPTTAASDYPAAAIRDAVLIEGSRDDVAILTVNVGAPPQLAIWSFDAGDSDAAVCARAEIGARLRAAGYAPDAVVTAELVVTELIGNTVRYAPGPIDVMLESVEHAPIVHVLDRGPGFAFSPKLPPDVFSESGRGLFLIAALARELNVGRRPDGGSHARVVLAL